MNLLNIFLDIQKAFLYSLYGFWGQPSAPAKKHKKPHLPIILTAIALSMGVITLVLAVMNERGMLEERPEFGIFLGIAVFCLALVQLDQLDKNNLSKLIVLLNIFSNFPLAI